MKALILAAGRGTRVQPLTLKMPKPMMPIINTPVMETLVNLLERHGVSQVMVNTSYMAPDIEAYFRDGSGFGVEMAYSFEGRMVDGQLIDEPMGSAGALRKIQDHSGFFDDTFIVLCGDAIIDLDLEEAVKFHRSRGALATIVLAEVERSQVSSYGVVVTDEDGRIHEFQEKPAVEAAKSTTINTGIYIFEPEVLDYIPTGVAYDIGGQLFPALVADGAALYGVNEPLEWLDIGKVSDYYDVMQMALRGEVKGVPLPGTEIAPGIWAGLNVNVDLEHSKLVPPIYLGGSCEIRPGATIIGPTMIGVGSIIEEGARIEKSIIFDYTRVGSHAQVSKIMICGGYCVNAVGTVIDLERSTVDWIITDARSPKKILTAEQQDFLEMLFQVNLGAEED
jgi:mannose-1-phosphate guanylyltransferase